MKMHSGVFGNGVLLLGALLFSGWTCFAQGTVTILPNVTRITDCETGQLVGAGYLAAYYWAPNTTTDRAQFTQVGVHTAVVGGVLTGGTRTITGAPAPGVSVNLYAAAWESAYGNSYEIASQVPGARVGCSAIVSALVGGSAVRIPDFQVCPVPEPSSWALLALGAGAVGLVRRRKSS